DDLGRQAVKLIDEQNNRLFKDTAITIKESPKSLPVISGIYPEFEGLPDQHRDIVKKVVYVIIILEYRPLDGHGANDKAVTIPGLDVIPDLSHDPGLASLPGCPDGKISATLLYNVAN
ncbi:hypothetical protein MBAV_005404, partial [Candidatus Magnetobacterium bavaricum]